MRTIMAFNNNLMHSHIYGFEGLHFVRLRFAFHSLVAAVAIHFTPLAVIAIVVDDKIQCCVSCCTI